MAGAQVRYLDDGAIPNTEGGWDLPAQGSCSVDAVNQPTRPDCVALRIVAANSTACTTALGSWTTGGVCNDLINTNQAACEAAIDRKWNAGTGVCSVVMMDDDRNNVVCAMHQGTWVTTGTCIGNWIMPARTVYTPNLLTGNSAGDQCLRCHNGRTQYNGPRVRDTQETLYQGHKNMSRKVTPPMPWGGPPFACTGFPTQTTEEGCFLAGGVWDPTIYPGTDSGQDFNWANGTVDIGTVTPNPRGLYWIYADWLSAYPRAVYHDVADTTATPDKPKVSYSCARCHTTGWTADTVLQTGKEPEASFPGITWDGVADAIDGQVNLAPGAPYNTKMASWDLFGITCTRCHNSAVDLGNPVVPAEVPPRYNAPAGMATHHNNLTVPDISGTCTDPRFTREFECTANAGLWLTACSVNPTPAICTVTAGTTQTLCEATPGNVWTAAPFCSNARFNADQTACTTNGFSWTQGWCTSGTPPAGAPPTQTCGSGQSLRLNGSQGSCQVAGGSWTFSKCSIEGVCNDPTNVLTRAECNTLGGQFAYATDVIRCEDAGGHWTGNNSNRGQIITNLCMNCHRQETGGLPYDATNPATALKVGPYHGTVPFLSHPHANQFLNSPHAKFTGTFAQIPTGKFNYAMTGEYKSFYMTEGEAAGTGNGCTGCHEVHTSIVTGDSPFREECTECHAKDLGTIMHPLGEGTPMEDMAHDPMEACVSCHMPEGEHLFRINVDPAYKTRPTASMTGTANANTAPDGDYAAAVWVDLDAACGKCHGGGIANVVTTGSITAGSKLLTVPNGALFTGEQRIEIKGAGSPYYDDAPGHAKLNDDFSTYVVSVAGNVVTLAGTATKTVTNAVVEQNPVKNGGGYMTKAELAVLAKGIHNDKPYATFGYTLTPANTLEVNVNASFSTCSGDIANCDAFEWSWGDATPDGSGVTASHTYAAAGTYSVTLTVHEYGVNEGSVSKKVRTFAVDAPPVAGGTDCASIINPNTWVGTLVDGSTDDNGVTQVTVNWGDGGALSRGTAGATLTRSYLNASAGVTIKHTAYDTTGQANFRTCGPIPLTYFTISGNVRRLNNAPVASATVTIKKGATTVRTVFTNSLGNYTVTNLKPGTYNVTVVKTGLTFPGQFYNWTVGPSGSGLNFQSAQ
ncbi:MAG: carboxypeptidase regulatory-like domain-containing protein [Thermoanaerobaculia bacterium]|nr:carboxypeptidase regulatory-like domain-containing protein [Thermoanaerobaculia bacterium]